MAIAEGGYRTHPPETDRRARRIARARNLLNVLAIINFLLIVTWAFFRAFFCWDDYFCRPTESLLSPACLVCQADLLVVFLLPVSLLLLGAMLYLLYRHELPYERRLAAERPTRVPGLKAARSIHYSALALQRDGPGWWTLLLAALAAGIALYYVLSDAQSLLCLWVFNCG